MSLTSTANAMRAAKRSPGPAPPRARIGPKSAAASTGTKPRTAFPRAARQPAARRTSSRRDCGRDPAGYQSHLLYAEPDGTFSISAMVWLPGQQTMIHDHVAWCVTGVLQGREYEEIFAVTDSSRRSGSLRAA